MEANYALVYMNDLFVVVNKGWRDYQITDSNKCVYSIRKVESDDS